MSVVFRLAAHDGLLDVNPCAGGEMFDVGIRVDTIWSSPQVGAFLAPYKFAYLQMPLLIGLWTGQRDGDVLRLKWSRYDGQTLKLNQHKGRRRGKQGQASTVVIPVVERLKAALDAELAARKPAKVSPLKIGDQRICLSSEGEAWQEGRKATCSPRPARRPASMA